MHRFSGIDYFSVMRKKLYIETSVWNQLEHDDRPDWRETAQKFVISLKQGYYEPYISTIVLDEIAATQDENLKRRLFQHISDIQPIALDFDEEAQLLTQKYMDADFIKSRSLSIYNDSSHVAIATVNSIRHLISFNCRHLVNDRRIDGFNGINLQYGYEHIVDITTPDKFILSRSEEV